MGVVEEIMLRQSVRFGLLLAGGGAALIYALWFCYRGASGLKTLVKAIPMLAFAVAVWVSFGHPLITLALLASALGDIALSRSGERAFLVGLISFAVAHLFYILRFWGLVGLEGVIALPWAAGLVIIFALSTERWLIPHTEDLKVPVRIYVGLISLMGLTALGLTAVPVAVIGAFAFMASDTILAIQLFRMTEASRLQIPASILLWLLYAGGQLAIVIGVGWAEPLFHL
ncbi:lysoplasmalogenase [Shimia aestuarii]|uniref:lysoplasmalogenase n=1 Tax=Shimia aestuarii TaxID=254406 RepID=UPI001FB2D105|nr:lysoplasmalogenase [Shimia aestuarii]